MGGKKKVRNNIRMKLEEKKRREVKQQNEMNPFELKRNKIKHQILGRKIAKNEMGKPLLSRSRGYQKRSQTLLEEYRNKDKSGRGVRDLREMNTDERVTYKYKENQKEINLYQAEEIKLTHKGKPLDDFIDDRLSSDDEDIDLFSRDDFVERTHFGGGDDGAPRSSRDVLHDIMQEKHEKKAAKEEAVQLTEKLDSQWTELKSLMRFKGPKIPTDSTRDEYDSLLTQLIFEGKKPVQEVQKDATSSPQKAEGVKEVEKETALTANSPDAVLKSKLKQIDASSDVETVVKLLKESMALLPTVTRKSFDMLKDRLQNCVPSRLKFTPKEMALLMMCANFKELQVLTHLLILQTLGKLKYSTYHEVAVSLFLNNFLLRSITDQALFYPELFIHVHNLIRLCLPQAKVKLALFTRLDYEAECILSSKKYCDDRTMAQSPQLTVTPLTLFDRVFMDHSKFDDKVLAYNLAVQVVQLASTLINRYSQMAITARMLRSIRSDLQSISSQALLSVEMSTLMEQIKVKFASQSPSAPQVIVNRTLPKPFILPMLEPIFEEGSIGKKSKGDETKKLAKKLKREFKGAQREIRKDATFLRNTYLKEIEKKDRTRQQKVKEILRDLSVQQGLYKKKKWFYYDIHTTLVIHKVNCLFCLLCSIPC